MPSLASVTPEFLDTAPFRVVVEKTVSASVDECWKLIADQTAWLDWFAGMSAVEADPAIWTEPGQTRRVTVNGLKVNERAISIEPNVEYGFEITKWPLPIASRAAEGVRLEDRSSGDSPSTVLTYIGAFDLNALGRLLRPILRKQFTAAWGPAFVALGEMAQQNERTG